MRTAVIADVHANLEALNAVLERIHALQASRILCLGDLVGYNANPNECVSLLMQEQAVCIMGNHDAIAAGLEEPDNFNPRARSAVLWTREQLSDYHTTFIRGLPRERETDDGFLFHGSIHDTNRYIFSRDDVADNFTLLAGLPGNIQVGFFGHTHMGIMLTERQWLPADEQPDGVPLIAGKRYLINPGSVGQPRDGDPRPSFLIYDRGERRVTYHRVEYDIKTCQEKILKAGLSEHLAARLALGR